MIQLKLDFPHKILPNGVPTNQTLLDLQRMLTLAGCRDFEYRLMKTNVVVEVVVPGNLAKVDAIGDIITNTINRNGEVAP